VSKTYHCYRCGKWFEKATKREDKIFGEIELCSFCNGRAGQVRGIKAALVRFWWWLKKKN